MKLLFFFLFIASFGMAQILPNIKDTTSCPNTPDGRPRLPLPTKTSGDLQKIVLNAPGAVCNDGTPAIMYVRPARVSATEPDGPSANRWLIHFEGGGSCTTFEECGVRWCGLGFYTAHQMSSTFEENFISRNGLLNRNGTNRLADRNLVMLNYCSSDSWSGRKSDVALRSVDDPTKGYSVHFQGATITQAAFAALERGVTGMPKLTDATDLLISGDSAGASAVRTHLDRIAARMKTISPNARVRGQMEATFYPDLNGKQGFPAGDPRDPVFANRTEKFNRIDVALLNSIQDDSCIAAQPQAQYLCGENGYVELNHITTPFFQMQDVQDPGMLENLEEAGLQASVAAIAGGLHEQLIALTNIRSTAMERAAITQAPSVVARNCGVHVTWSEEDGFFGKKYRTAPGSTTYSYYDLLWNWMTGASPSNLFVPKPPLTPEVPVIDSTCSAKAATGPTPPSIATASSASYNFAGEVAPDSIVATFGTNLTAGIATATANPWPTTLGGLQVMVTDSRSITRAAPLYYVSPTQLLYLIPAETAAGPAQITIGSQRTTVQVAVTAPGIYSASQNGKGVAAATYIRLTSRGVRSEGLLTDLGVPAAAGDQIYLLLYGTGLRGGPATATVGGISVPVAGPVAQGQYQGLDQINLGPLPLRVGLGQKEIVIRQGEELANIVTVTFRAAP